MEEFALIRKLTDRGGKRSQMNGPQLAVGIGDDAAVAPATPGRQLVMACDTMVEEIHFKVNTMKPEDVGYKAMASNISDIAAMGGVPRYALAALTISDEVEESWLERVYDGLYECAEQYGVTIAGGDVSSTRGGIVLSISIVGEVETDQALVRSAAKSGDIVAVTGPLGLSAAGLHYLLGQQAPAEELTLTDEVLRQIVKAHQRPNPRVTQGRLLLGTVSRAACNDISDGLASEAWEIAEASGCGLLLEEELLPLSQELEQYAKRSGHNPLKWLLYGGEDYELLTCIPAQEYDKLAQCFQEHQLPLYRIGTVTNEFEGVQLLDRDKQLVNIPKSGYNHFQADRGD